MLDPIKVSFKHTSNAFEANRWLREIAKHKVIACDFEVASKYTSDELESFQSYFDNESNPYLLRMDAKSLYYSNALSHPYYTVLTHLSVAWSESEGVVFVLDNPSITRRILQYLVTTDQIQVWHNASYDFKQIYYRTGQFPKEYEDTQIYLKTLINHVDTYKANTRLKDTAAAVYGQWSISSDNFSVDQMYEPHVLLYAATDSCATMWLYNRLVENAEQNNFERVSTNSDYSPWDQLPAPEPKLCNYHQSHFYHYTAKHLIKDTVKIMMNGLGINLNKVYELEDTIDVSINSVKQSLYANPIIQRYIKEAKKKELAAYIKDRKSKLRSPDYYLKPFKHNEVNNRSYFMYVFSKKLNISQPSELLPTGVPKWSASLVSKLSSEYPILKRMLKGELPQDTPTAQKAIQLLAQDKADMYNQKFLNQINNPDLPDENINIRSSDVKHTIFTSILGYESGTKTDAYEKYERDLDKAIKYGKPLPKQPKNTWSWGRKQIEMLLDTLSDPDEISLCKQFIEFSFGDKIKTSFIPAFYKYTLDGRLYSNLKLLGAKSARFTSNNPNMLQLPSTGSIYASAVKSCFVSNKDTVILTADFNALEDRVLASITRDEGKCALLEDPTLDGHCYNALGYYGPKVEQYLTSNGSYKDKVREFAQLVDKKHKQLKDIRQDSKPVTFKLAYGGVADEHKGGAITQEIYDNYHYTLYPGVRDYIDNYVIPTAKSNGHIHLGLGFNIYTDFPDKDQRTLHNATIQFWSILSILAINKMHHLIDQNGLQDDVRIISSIYDSIYFEVTKDPDVIKWVNDNLITIMTKDFMENQRIPNDAESEIGYSWASLYKLPHNSSLEEIQNILIKMEE